MRLLQVKDPIGSANNKTILDMANRAKTVILAYGQPPRRFHERGAEVARLLRSHPHLCYLRLSKNGTPVHPLYLPANLKPKQYETFPSPRPATREDHPSP